MMNKKVYKRLIISILIIGIIHFTSACNDGGVFIHYTDCNSFCENNAHIFDLNPENNYISMAGYYSTWEMRGNFGKYYGIGTGNWLNALENDVTVGYLGEDGEEGYGRKMYSRWQFNHDTISGSPETATNTFEREEVPRQDSVDSYLEFTQEEDGTIIAAYTHRVINPCSKKRIQIEFVRDGTDDTEATCQTDFTDENWDEVFIIDPGEDKCQGSENFGINPSEKCVELENSDFEIVGSELPEFNDALQALIDEMDG